MHFSDKDKNLKDLANRVGIIGAGNFGTAIANIVAENGSPLLYIRSGEKFEKIKKDRVCSGQNLHEKINITNCLKELVKTRSVIFIFIPAKNLIECLNDIKPYLNRHHVIIHGIKGAFSNLTENTHFERMDIKTASQIISEYTRCKYIGCISGPNISTELADLQPSATVIASKSIKVLLYAKATLETDRFDVFVTEDIVSLELCGILKNIISIAIGFVEGKGLGANVVGLLITYGLEEMMNITHKLGYNPSTFWGIGGVGDLVATSKSKNSRNYKFGFMLGKGMDKEEILKEINQPVDGVNSLKNVYEVLKERSIYAPIITTLYSMIFLNEKNDNVVKKLLKRHKI